jgi:tetratricopeptide (TPR) repeat protein
MSRIRNRKVIFFLGAGISKNSGLPLAKELKSYLLKRLCDDLQLAYLHEKCLNNVSLPFESFIQIFVDYPKGFFGSFLEIYKLGKPNANHFLMSNLIKDGHVSEIMTTNFDILLEEALSITHVNFSVLSDEKQFLSAEKGKGISPVIYKLHGSIDNPNSIRVTLNMIAQKDLFQSRLKILSHFFDRNDVDVVFLGYSCSDEFDINVLIRNMKSSANILYIKHSNNTLFTIEPLNYPFQGWSGSQIVCNTNDIIRELSKGFGYTIPITSSSEDWTVIIDEWCDTLDLGDKYYFLGCILSDIGEIESSNAVLEKGLEYATEYVKARIENTLVRVALMRSDYASARLRLQSSIPIFKKYNETMRVAESLFRLGQIEKRIGNYKEAKKYFDKSLKICKEIDYRLGIERSLTEIGMLYKRTGNFDKAEEKYAESLSLSEEIGDLHGISNNLHELGIIKRKSGEYDVAEKHLKTALEIKTKLGNKTELAYSKGELALVLVEKKDYPSAEILLNECLKLFKEANDLYGISHALHEIGNLYFRKKELQKAEKYYLKSLKIKQRISDHEGIANVYGQIGNIRMFQGLRNEAKKYFRKCYQIYKKLKNKHGMGLAKKCLNMV